MPDSYQKDDTERPAGGVAIEARTCSAYDIPISKDNVIEARSCSAYDIPISSDDNRSMETRTCSAYNIPITTTSSSSIEGRTCSDYDIPISKDKVVEARSCSAYDIPISSSMEARTCSSYNIPITSNNGSIEVRTCSDYDIPMRTCSDYNIPIASCNNNNCHPIPEQDFSSSVLDQDTIASRGIGKDDALTRDQVSAEIRAFLDLPFAVADEIRMLWTVVIFITILPVPTTKVDLHPGFLMKGMVYLPLVGTLVGILVATVYDAAEKTLGLPPVLAAAVSTAAGWYLTGCFHEDGLCDSADGIGGGWTRAQIFKIMTDSRVGTYGVAVLSLYITTKVQLLAALGGSVWNWNASQGAGPALILAHCMARVTAPYLIRSFDYVDDEQGPKSSFYAFMVQAKHLVSLPRVLAAVAFGWTVSSLLYGPTIAAALMILTLSFAQFAGNYGNAKLGGVMGDFLGATICVCELLILGLLLVVQQGQSSSWAGSGSIQNFFLEAKAVLQDQRILALLRFLLAFIVLKAWLVFCNNSHEKVPKNDTTSNGSTTVTVKTSTSNGSKNPTVEEATPKSEAARILSLATCTFGERYDAVQTYLDVLAKPVGSLGTLECWAARLAALQRTLQPSAKNIACLIFAGDHGVAAAPEDGGEGCSAYPQAVTKSILIGLERGVAGASVLARANSVALRVIDVGVILGDDNQFQNGKNVMSSPLKLARGTRNFCVEPAMSAEECQRCMKIGRDSLVQYSADTSANVMVLGEVGIGNTTSSSAIVAALTLRPVEELCGGGAFATRELSEDIVLKKIDIVKRALAIHYSGNPVIQAEDALAKLGGAEVAAMVGALLEASDRDIAILVDGFIATAAALVAVCVSPYVCHVLFFASNSAEPGQQAAIEKIQVIAKENNIPIDRCAVLSMDLRMGEATAALLAVPILRSSAEVLSDMATIEDILS